MDYKCWPEDWIPSCIVPLLEAQDDELAENYIEEYIALGSCVAKVMTRVLAGRLQVGPQKSEFVRVHEFRLGRG